MGLKEALRKTAVRSTIIQLQEMLGIETNREYLERLPEDKLVEIRDFLVVKYNEEVKND